MRANKLPSFQCCTYQWYDSYYDQLYTRLTGSAINLLPFKLEYQKGCFYVPEDRLSRTYCPKNDTLKRSFEIRLESAPYSRWFIGICEQKYMTSFELCRLGTLLVRYPHNRDWIHFILFEGIAAKRLAEKREFARWVIPALNTGGFEEYENSLPESAT
jgi:hypothetical protein